MSDATAQSPLDPQLRRIGTTNIHFKCMYWIFGTYGTALGVKIMKVLPRPPAWRGGQTGFQADQRDLVVLEGPSSSPDSLHRTQPCPAGARRRGPQELIKPSPT